MPNDIPQRQNQAEFVNRIAASSRAYELVERLARWQSGLAIIAAVAGPVVRLSYPVAVPWAAYFSCGVILINLVLERRERKYRRLGAKVQEVFDTALLNLTWNSHRCQAAPDHEEINSLAEAYRKRSTTERLLNWYPVEAGSIPLEYARFVCQRANMRWDMELRRKFAALFYVAAALAVGGLGCVALAMNWTASEVLVSLVVPALPLAVKLVQQGLKHTDSAEISERAKGMLETIWSNALVSGTDVAQLSEDARRLQDELFDRRCTTPKVPQRLYLWWKDDLERDMQFAAKQMVKEAQAKLGNAIA